MASDTRELGSAQGRPFLDHVAKSEKGPVTCLERAREALIFLDEDLLRQPSGELAPPRPPTLLDRVRHRVRLRHDSPRTGECYVEWAARSI